MIKEAQRSSVKAPRQKRSVKTHNALLDAAERLLRDRPWEEISTVAIMIEAGVSNGAIYGRFKSKDDLLVALYERHDEQLKNRFDQKGKSHLPVHGETIEHFLDREIDELIAVFVEHKWMLRAMGILSRQKPEVVSAKMRADRKTIFERIVSRFMPYRHAVDNSDAERQLELVVFFVSTLLREAILHPGPHFDSLEIGQEEFADAVRQMAIRYLDVSPKAAALIEK